MLTRAHVLLLCWTALMSNLAFSQSFHALYPGGLIVINNEQVSCSEPTDGFHRQYLCNFSNVDTAKAVCRKSQNVNYADACLREVTLAGFFDEAAVQICSKQPTWDYITQCFKFARNRVYSPDDISYCKNRQGALQINNCLFSSGRYYYCYEQASSSLEP
jgi:hypothetical protein